MIKYFLPLFITLSCLAAGTNPVVYLVSSSNGFPSIIVYSNNVVFGPQGRINTVGTTTAGIQEAINALPQSNNRSNQLGGGTVILSSGIFYCSNSIIIPSINTTNPFYCEIKGQGMAATAIVQLGTNRSLMKVGYPYGYNTVQFKISDCTLSAIGNAVTNIIYIDGYSDASFGIFGGVGDRWIERCYFGQWELLTNNPSFGFAPGEHNTFSVKNNLLAIDDKVNYSAGLRIRDCQFSFCQPIRVCGPRTEIVNCQFMNAGRCSTPVTNDWPISSPLYLGACITIDNPPILDNCGGQMHYFRDNFFITCKLGYYAGTCAQPIYSYNDRIESDGTGLEYLIATPGRNWTSYDHVSRPGTQDEIAIYRALLVTNTSNFSSGYDNPDVTNCVQILKPRETRVFRDIGILTNTYSFIPSAPIRPGAFNFFNSNGTPFMIVSTNGSGVGTNIWTGTNRMDASTSIPYQISASAGLAGLSNITTTGASLGINGIFMETVVPTAGAYFFESMMGFMYSNLVASSQQVIILNYTNVQAASAGSQMTIPLPLINNYTGGVCITFPYIYSCNAGDTIRVQAKLSGSLTSGNIYFTNYYRTAFKLQ